MQWFLFKEYCLFIIAASNILSFLHDFLITLKSLHSISTWLGNVCLCDSFNLFYLQLHCFLQVWSSELSQNYNFICKPWLNVTFIGFINCYLIRFNYCSSRKAISGWTYYRICLCSWLYSWIFVLKIRLQLRYGSMLYQIYWSN